MYDDDTDISAGHLMAVRRPDPHAHAPPTLDAVRRKTKLVLWIVNNCHPYSGQMEYAEKLATYVTVDVVGRCGNLSCPSQMTDTMCIASLSKDYMFYLAFEDSYCKDYLTEKVTGPLTHSMVPITMGGANYSKFLPPHSYIDANDLSPTQLAHKLLHLKEHTDEYMMYFQWKIDYQLSRNLRTQGFCKLCEILHTTNYPYKSNFSVAQYWDSKTLCLTKEEHLKLLGMN